MRAQARPCGGKVAASRACEPRGPQLAQETWQEQPSGLMKVMLHEGRPLDC